MSEGKKVKNADDLLQNSMDKTIRRGRELIIDAINIGISSVAPSSVVGNRVRHSGNSLEIMDAYGLVHSFDLSGYDGIYVVGFGKYISFFAEAIEMKLGDIILDGVVLDAKRYAHGRPKKIKVLRGSHPIPSDDNIAAARYIIDFVEGLPTDAFVLALVMGGASALFSYPIEPITINDLVEATKTMLMEGLDIYDINTIRKHISNIKGGKFAEVVYPRKLVGLVISDIPGDNISFIGSGPTSPDPTTYQDAHRIIQRYNMEEKLPESVIQVINRGVRGEISETPKPESKIFKNVDNFVIANNSLALRTIHNYFRSKKIECLLLTDRLRGEAREVGKALGSIIYSYPELNSRSKPTAIICGGETMVTVRGHGKGGRNQELALSVAIELNGILKSRKIVFASIGTDGIDYIEDVAGGIVDKFSYERAKKEGIDPLLCLENNDSYTFFKTLNDHIITGITGTNVADIMIGIHLD